MLGFAYVELLGRCGWRRVHGSHALGGVAPVRLLPPPDFARRPRARWPVLYLLHGANDSYVSWTRSTDVEALTARTDLLVAMPEAGMAGFYSNWWNYGRGVVPGWETFHLRELPEVLNRGLRAGSRRAVAGLSMGGFGALSYAGRHPGMFRAAASFSGILETTYPHAAPLAPTIPDLILGILSSAGYDPLRLWGDPTRQAEIWAAHNPYDLLPRLRGVRLFVAAGNGYPGPLDPPGTPRNSLGALIERGLYPTSLASVAKASRLGIHVATHFYGNGTHDWPYWRRDPHHAFPLLARSIGAETSP